MEIAKNITSKLRFFDIAANLADLQFSGEYYEKKHHQNDVEQVIQRAQDIGCDRLLIVGGYIEDSKLSYNICQQFGYGKFYTTVGVHPCRVDEVEKNTTQEEYFQQMVDLIKQYGNKCVAIGECGLDYDRFDYCSKEMQLKHFPMHFDLAKQFNLPMYLHNRNTGTDFFDIVRANRDKFSQGVVHSFTGTEEELKQCLDLDLYIGVNGCSLKTKENIENVKKIPLNKLMIETDAPYCEIRNSSAGSQYVKTKFKSIKKEKWNPDMLVKGRNEPCQIIQVLEVLEQVLQIPSQKLAEQCYLNTLKFFNLKDEDIKENQSEEDKKKE